MAQVCDGIDRARQGLFALVNDAGEIEQDCAYHRARMSSTPTRVNRAAKSQLRAHPRLLRIVVREAHDARRQALLVAVELADLDLSADPGMGDVEPRKRDGLIQDRR